MNLTEEVRKELVEHIIPFWKSLRDDENGGYYGYLDYDLTMDRQAEKGCILNSRILWFFANAYLTLKDESLLVEAAHAYEFMRKVFVDSEFGGVFWSATYDGNVADTTKHTYNQAFAIYALASYYDASGDESAWKLAFDLFRRIESTCTDEYGYLESFTEDWHPEDNEKLSENGLLADKTMNTLLHVLEAYTELYRVSGDDEVGEKLKRILIAFKDQVYNKETKRLEVFFDARMQTISDLYSYGHDIEASWLLDRAAEVLAEDWKLAEETYRYTTEIAEEVYAEALDADNDHGVMNNECFHGVVDHTRVWWVQAEAMVGFLNCYAKTGDPRYEELVRKLWIYIKTYVIDPREGSEWFWDLNEKNEPTSRKPIVEPWKCPYHNGRMCMEIIRRSEG